MGERKVLNKYYPPDFDPAKIPRRRKPKNEQMKVRMMLPMSIRCTTCGNYIYKGTKFNMRKEDVEDETYLGIQIFRFYFKCTRCSAELAMKTDPQNSDYVMESGATRNYEPWREKDEALDAAKKKQEMEEMGDAMKVLENRTISSKQEMDILASLDEMKSLREIQQRVNTDDMLSALKKTAVEREQELEEQDERMIRSVVFQNSSGFVRRVEDEEDDDDDEKLPKRNGAETSGRGPLSMAAEDLQPSKKLRLESREDREGQAPAVGQDAPSVDPLVSHARVEASEGTGKLGRGDVPLVSSRKLPAPSFAVKFKRPTIQLKAKAEVAQVVSTPKVAPAVPNGGSSVASAGVGRSVAGSLASLAAYDSDDDDDDDDV